MVCPGRAPRASMAAPPPARSPPGGHACNASGARPVALALVVALCPSSLPAAAVQLGSGIALAATVPWPVSSLVVSEVQTGGSSASDEFAEIATRAVRPSIQRTRGRLLHLDGLDRHAQGGVEWSTVLAPGRRTLRVQRRWFLRRCGRHDLYGRFRGDRRGHHAAHRRRVGDRRGRLGRRDERVRGGDAGRGPGAFSSIERRPGGPAGNGTDTNDNATDWFVTTTPSPQNLASPSVPGADPTPTATTAPPPSPTPTASPVETPTPSPTDVPTPSPTAEPTASPTAEPTPTPEPTGTPTPVPTPVPTATP